MLLEEYSRRENLSLKRYLRVDLIEREHERNKILAIERSNQQKIRNMASERSSLFDDSRSVSINFN